MRKLRWKEIQISTVLREIIKEVTKVGRTFKKGLNYNLNSAKNEESALRIKENYGLERGHKIARLETRKKNKVWILNSAFTRTLRNN